MEQINNFQSLVADGYSEQSIFLFILNIIITATLAHFIGMVYIKYGGSLSNRPQFAKNFVLLAITTMLIITVVKSSLALSLGLIGALSIVRFRAAIKEPEELAYLFLVIAVGLGIGAEQQFLTIIAILLILVILRIKKYVEEDKAGPKHFDPDMFLSVSAETRNNLSIEKITEIVERNSLQYKMKRADFDENQINILFQLKVEDYSSAKNAETSLRKIDQHVKISLLEAN